MESSKNNFCLIKISHEKDENKSGEKKVKIVPFKQPLPPQKQGEKKATLASKHPKLKISIPL